jgi:hypothetical protein
MSDNEKSAEPTPAQADLPAPAPADAPVKAEAPRAENPEAPGLARQRHASSRFVRCHTWFRSRPRQAFRGLRSHVRIDSRRVQADLDRGDRHADRVQEPVHR